MKLDQRLNLAIMIGICLPPVIALIVWLVTIDSRATAAQNDLNGVREILVDVHDRVIKIEEYMKYRGNK